MSFSQALSGLSAANENITVIGNNIANSQTYGFKSQSPQFADVYAGSQVGQGVQVAGVAQDFSNGTLETTSQPLDLAINGQGFFQLRQGNQTVYSRNGQLTLNANGSIVNSSGAQLMGFPAGVGSGSTPVALQVPTTGMAAAPTTTAASAVNLDANSAAINPVATPFNPNNAATYSYASTGTVYDSLGNQHTLTLYYTKTAANTWSVQGTMDGTTLPQTGTLAFNTNGTLNTAASTPPTFAFTPTDGAAPMTVATTFSGTTQTGNDNALTAFQQNGNAAGSLTGVSFSSNGDLTGSYSNGQTQTLGTVALANFADPNGLTPVSGNAWQATPASGQALLGTAGTGELGQLETGTLEDSNVDLATQLVDLIQAQSDYQANAQTVKTQDAILQTAVQM
ncbi:MAG TPA: flagellar hook protein FlgE [Nevskiaceae bacterium]|nr:flagellar hook protein FlgE [Nevskiaceae bacterium]